MKPLLALLVLRLSPPCIARAYPPISVQMPRERVGMHTCYVRGAAGTATANEGFILNAGLVVTDAGVVVFDSLRSPSLAWALRRPTARLTDRPMVKVIVGHYHADHIEGLNLFEDEAAEIITPESMT